MLLSEEASKIDVFLTKRLNSSNDFSLNFKVVSIWQENTLRKIQKKYLI